MWSFHRFALHARNIGRCSSLFPARRFASLPRNDSNELGRSAPLELDPTLNRHPFDRQSLDSLLRRRLFYTPSFEAYGGVKGLFDYGPPGCSLQANIVDQWRKHFVLEEDMLEIDCTAITPYKILESSGHVERFADWMCKDPKNGEIQRADHFVRQILEGRLQDNKQAKGEKRSSSEKKLDASRNRREHNGTATKLLDISLVQEYENIIAKIDNYDGAELGDIIIQHDLRNPETGELPSKPEAFNLMFQTNIGASGAIKAFLRPETAQGQFMNFSKLLNYNQQQVPFASASIGKSFRNEISPRAGLLRVREFLMAEIEHYSDPDGGKEHPRFDEVKHIKLNLLDRETQMTSKTNVTNISIGEAVAEGIVDNETLGYFLARIHLFLKAIGVDESKLRFRQHMANEMAHYAADCWDAELLTSYGWIECVGCADRSAFDLSVHAKKTGASFLVRKRLDTPISINEWHVEINRKRFGPYFKIDGQAVEDTMKALTQEQYRTLAQDLESTGKIAIDVPGIKNNKVEIGKDMIQIKRRMRIENVREYIPNVIEPSFGIGRILYALLEHNFWIRDGENGSETRGVLSFPPSIAPTKVLLVPLSSHESFEPTLRRLSRKLRSCGISSRIDDSSASIGKRYSRSDELGTPVAITVDFQSMQDGTFTLRDRDSTRQVRSDESQVLEAIKLLLDGSKDWATIATELPTFEGQTIEGMPNQDRHS